MPDVKKSNIKLLVLKPDATAEGKLRLPLKTTNTDLKTRSIMLKFRGGMQAPEKDVPKGKAALGGFSTQSRVSLIGACRTLNPDRTRPYRGVLSVRVSRRTIYSDARACPRQRRRKG